jgi:hypothetical protein
MFELTERLGSAKQKLLESVGVVDSSVTEHPNVSLSTPVSTFVRHKTAISLTSYSLEAELKQAQVLKYLRMSDRPK